jgi:hypothetical protein
MKGEYALDGLYEPMINQYIGIVEMKLKREQWRTEGGQKGSVATSEFGKNPAITPLCPPRF